jgi:hypothetical protein
MPSAASACAPAGVSPPAEASREVCGWVIVAIVEKRG